MICLTEWKKSASGVEPYAIYLRKSRADEKAEEMGEGETLARHKKILTDFAARKGLFVAEIYQEIVSGETIAARPEIQRLIRDCYAGKYRGIIIVEVTRLSRGNQGDAQTILDCLRYSNRNQGLLVYTPTKVYDVAHSSEDEEFMEFELFMSRREYTMIKKRMDRGRKQAIVEGNYMGSYRPYGYNIVKTRTARTLEPNPDEAPIVQMIFNLAVKEHYSTGQIARQLTSMGVPTYTANREWLSGSVKAILQNPIYIGRVRWNERMRVKTMVDGKLVASRPRANGEADYYMEYDGKHPPLVDKKTFTAANNKFYSDKTREGYALLNPLAGLLRCKNCGRMMVYHPYKKQNTAPRYSHPSSQLCKVKSAARPEVIAAVAQSLRMYIADFEVKINGGDAVGEDEIQAQADAMRGQIKDAERKLDKLFTAWENGSLSDNEFVSRKAVHNERIAQIQAQLKKLEDRIPEKAMYEEKIRKLSDALRALEDDSLTAETQNQFLKAILDRIEFSREDADSFILDVFLKEDNID